MSPLVRSSVILPTATGTAPLCLSHILSAHCLLQPHAAPGVKWLHFVSVTLDIPSLLLCLSTWWNTCKTWSPILMYMQIGNRRLNIHGQHVTSEDKSQWKNIPRFSSISRHIPHSFSWDSQQDGGFSSLFYSSLAHCSSSRLFLKINYLHMNLVPNPAFRGIWAEHDHYGMRPKWRVSLMDSRSAPWLMCIEALLISDMFWSKCTVCFDSIPISSPTKWVWWVLFYLSMRHGKVT